MKEVWKPVKGYEGLYEVSNIGRVKSLKRNSEKILKSGIVRGYEQVQLCKDGTREQKKVHRLVAEAFIPNQNNYPQVNHKDEDKRNNCVGNLEWCTARYNNNYGNRTEKTGKSVRCLETGEVFTSIREAARSINGNSGSLCQALKGKRKTANGFHWEYERGQNSSV